MRRHRSPAIVVAALALVAAVAGTALAGSGPDANGSASTKKTAKKALKLAKKNKKSIRNIELTPGPQGEKGDDGSANAASLVSGSIEPTPVPGTTEYWPVTGKGNALGSPTESDVTTLSPNRAILVRDLAVELDIAPGGTASLAFTLRANGLDGLSCSISGAVKTCNSGGGSMTIPAGAKLSLEVVSSLNPVAGVRAWFGWRPASLAG